jgi:hypothetical protein
MITMDVGFACLTLTHVEKRPPGSCARTGQQCRVTLQRQVLFVCCLRKSSKDRFLVYLKSLKLLRLLRKDEAAKRKLASSSLLEKQFIRTPGR